MHLPVFFPCCQNITKNHNAFENGFFCLNPYDENNNHNKKSVRIIFVRGREVFFFSTKKKTKSLFSGGGYSRNLKSTFFFVIEGAMTITSSYVSDCSYNFNGFYFFSCI